MPLPSEQEASQQVVSPFSQTTATVAPSGHRRSSAWLIWLLVGIVVVAGLGTAGYFIGQYLNDPYRTLEPFPMDKYLSDYRSMTGNKFKADLKVSADLGYTPETGRLMVFTLPEDSRSLVVLIPPKFSGLYFTKGQNYQASLEVQQDGTVYADTCEKE